MAKTRIGKATLNVTSMQFTIALRPRRVLPSVLGHPFYFPVWSVAGFLVVRQALQNDPYYWGTLLGTGCWIAFEVAGLHTLLITYFGKEVLMVSQRGFSFSHQIFGIGTQQTFSFRETHNLRVMPAAKSHEAKLAFETSTQMIQCGYNIGIPEAHDICLYITELLTFRCPAITTIVFGEFPDVVESDPMLLNPDLTSLTFPFVRLQRVVIDTRTYDFRQVEQFVTYAVNALGQRYVKSSIEVYFVGGLETIHPNIRNSLTHLCRAVYTIDTTTVERLLDTAYLSTTFHETKAYQTGVYGFVKVWHL